MALAGFSLILPVGSFTVEFTGFLRRGECDGERIKHWPLPLLLATTETVKTPPCSPNSLFFRSVFSKPLFAQG